MTHPIRPTREEWRGCSSNQGEAGHFFIEISSSPSAWTDLAQFNPLWSCSSASFMYRHGPPQSVVRQLQSSLRLLLLLSSWTPFLHRAESFSVKTLSQPRPATADVVAEFFGNEIGAELQQQQNVQDVCISDDNDDGGILAALFGSTETLNDFFKHTFGRRVAYFPRSKDLAINGNDDHQQLGPPVSGIDLPSLYETNECTSLRIRGSLDMLDKEQMNYNDLLEYIAGGGSIIISMTPDDYLFPTKLQIERALGLKEDTGTTMNIYHSGPSAVALNIHYDAYPVFVLQLEGQKEWILQDNAFGMAKSDITKWKNLTMTEGDLLYIPKGVWHAATTAEGYATTTHATIGLL